MTNYLDRSIEALLARRALAEKATPEAWWYAHQKKNGCGIRYVLRREDEVGICEVNPQRGLGEEGAQWTARFIARNSPDVIMADIDEILSLRAEVKRLEKETDWLARICAEQMLEGVDEASVQWWRDKAREAARKAVEENQCKN